MVKVIIYLCALLILVGISQGLLNHFRILGSGPNLLLLYVLFLAIEQRNLDVVPVAVVAGLFSDLIGGFPVGSLTIAFVLVGAVGHVLLTRFVFFHSLWRYLPLMVVGTVLFVYGFSVLVNFLLSVLHLSPVLVDVRSVRYHLMGLVIYHLLMAYPVYFFYVLVHRILERFEQRKKGGFTL